MTVKERHAAWSRWTDAYEAMDAVIGVKEPPAVPILLARIKRIETAWSEMQEAWRRLDDGKFWKGRE